MQYFVLFDNQRYGPADLNTLNVWAQEGRITSTTMLEEAGTGRQVTAAMIPGLAIPGPAGYQPPPTNPYPPNMSPNTNYGAPGPGTNWSQAPTAYQNYNEAQAQQKYTLGMVFSIIGIFTCCLLSLVGIHFGTEAKKLGHPNAQLPITIGIIAVVINILGGIFFRFLDL